MARFLGYGAKPVCTGAGRALFHNGAAAVGRGELPGWDGRSPEKAIFYGAKAALYGTVRALREVGSYAKRTRALYWVETAARN